MWDTAVSTSQTALASTRTAPPGPRASRTASTRARSSGRESGWSATFTLAVRHPESATIPWARSGPTAGTVQLTGTASRTGSGQPTVHCSTAVASHAAEVASS